MAERLGPTLLEDPFAESELAGEPEELATLAGHAHAKDLMQARLAGQTMATSSTTASTAAAATPKVVTFADDAHAGDEGAAPQRGRRRGKKS